MKEYKEEDNCFKSFLLPKYKLPYADAFRHSKRDVPA